MKKFWEGTADILRIIWYLGWRFAAVIAGFIGLMYLANWSWWQV